MRVNDLLRLVQSNQTAIKTIGEEIKVLKHGYDAVKKKLAWLETEKVRIDEVEYKRKIKNSLCNEEDGSKQRIS